MNHPPPENLSGARIALRQAKRVVIAIVGGTIVLIGIALIVLPGPAFVVIPAGLAVLAIEFEWSRRWLTKLRSWIERMKAKTIARGTNERPD